MSDKPTSPAMRAAEIHYLGRGGYSRKLREQTHSEIVNLAQIIEEETRYNELADMLHTVLEDCSVNLDLRMKALHLLSKTRRRE